MEKTQENTEKCTFCMIFQKIFFKNALLFELYL